MENIIIIIFVIIFKLTNLYILCLYPSEPSLRK